MGQRPLPQRDFRGDLQLVATAAQYLDQFVTRSNENDRPNPVLKEVI